MAAATLLFAVLSSRCRMRWRRTAVIGWDVTLLPLLAICTSRLLQNPLC